MIQFYAPEIEQSLLLPESESNHCIRVLRKKEGDEVIVTDGKGYRYKCRIVEAHPKHTKLEILEKSHGEDTLRGFKITLCVAPTKHIDRMEWMIEKCVEMGIDEIIFLRCAHSERKEVKIERLVKVALSAMNQSLKTVAPKIRFENKFDNFLKEMWVSPHKYMGYCDDKMERLEFVKEISAGEDILILIGPEGDFSPEEVKMAIESGFIPVTFGNSRLRTETACLYGVTAVHVINQMKQR